VEGSCEHGNEPAGKFLSSCTIGSFSRRAQLHERIWYLREVVCQCGKFDLEFMMPQGIACSMAS
jgi:hypothetical protein